MLYTAFTPSACTPETGQPSRIRTLGTGTSTPDTQQRHAQHLEQEQQLARKQFRHLPPPFLRSSSSILLHPAASSSASISPPSSPYSATATPSSYTHETASRNSPTSDTGNATTRNGATPDNRNSATPGARPTLGKNYTKGSSSTTPATVDQRNAHCARDWEQHDIKIPPEQHYTRRCTSRPESTTPGAARHQAPGTARRPTLEQHYARRPERHYTRDLE